LVSALLFAAVLGHGLVLGHIQCDFCEAGNKSLRKNFGRLECGLSWVELTEFEHYFKNVGTLVAHGHDFSTRLKLFKVLGC